jgi:polygalacturonase
MNGANNRINPEAGPWNNGRNQACVSVSGDDGRIDKMVLENNTFQNTAGTNFVVAGQSSKPGIRLGSGWTVRKNLFKNGGSNVTDFSAVSAWTDNVLAEENTFTNDNPPVTGNGLITAFEVHGSNHRFINNRVNNARRGVYVAANFTSVVKNTLNENNTFTNMVD